MMIKVNSRNNVPFVHITGIGSFFVSGLQNKECIDGSFTRITAETVDGIELTFSATARQVKSLLPLLFSVEWNGEGEPKPGQRVKINGGETGIVYMVGDFTPNKVRGVIVRYDNGGFLSTPYDMSVVMPVDRELTEDEKYNIAAVERLVSAGVISAEFGEEAIQSIKDGTKS